MWFRLLSSTLFYTPRPQELTRDADDYYSFHEVQHAIAAFREARIQGNKLVYPAVTSGDDPSKKKRMDMLTGGGSSMRKTKKDTGRGGKRRGKVSSSVACGTMFQFNKGQTNPDVIKQVICCYVCYITLHVFDVLPPVLLASLEHSVSCYNTSHIFCIQAILTTVTIVPSLSSSSSSPSSLSPSDQWLSEQARIQDQRHRRRQRERHDCQRASPTRSRASLQEPLLGPFNRQVLPWSVERHLQLEGHRDGQQGEGHSQQHHVEKKCNTGASFCGAEVS
jgi:hypothetical protein